MNLPVPKIINIKRIIAPALILFYFTVDAQINCENDTSFLVPIVDLQTGFYMGFQGGLYPGGLNDIPTAHLDSGIIQALSIIPINFDGEVDTMVGKVVMVGLGSGSAQKSFNKFISQYEDAGYTDSCVRIVNACISEQGIEQMIDEDADDFYWKDVNDFLQEEDLKKKQVAVVWVMNASFIDSVETMPAYVDSLKLKYIALIRKLKDQFPNVKLIYISGLQYGGYLAPDADHTNAYAEPAPYYNDFAIKAVIEAQINGDTLLNYSDDDAGAAWTCWGPNFWADGRNLRTYDNLRWICPGDFDTGGDGFFLSGTGQQKIADRLFDFFNTQPTTIPWFYGLPYECFTEIESEDPDDSIFIPEDEIIWITQNPVRGIIKFVINLETESKADVYVFNSLGQQIVKGAFYKIESGKTFSIKMATNLHGVYILSISIDGKVYNKPFYLDP
ncbi:MAG: T9SS type A sorting domain-containing protein [Chitinophagales bacterium]